MTLTSARFGPNVLGGLRELAVRMEADRDAALRFTGLALVRQIKMTLSTPGTGRWYVRSSPRRGRGHGLSPARRGGGGVRHRASKPGDPPAVDTGALRNSIAYEAEGRRHRVGTNMQKAPWLEYGTVQSGGKIAPRPFMRPALKTLERELGYQVAAALRTTRRGGL